MFCRRNEAGWCIASPLETPVNRSSVLTRRVNGARGLIGRASSPCWGSLWILFGSLHGFKCILCVDTVEEQMDGGGYEHDDRGREQTADRGEEHPETEQIRLFFGAALMIFPEGICVFGEC